MSRRALFLDCNAGMSGDMFLAALLDAGVDEAAWRAQLARLPLPDVDVTLERVSRRGVSCLKAHVEEPAEQPTRRLSDVKEIIEQAELSPRVHARAIAVFEKLAAAEARVHDTTPEEVHFHEVGAVDCIVDIVSASILLELSDVEVVIASPVRTGFGTVRCAHGQMPIPAPATALLLLGIPTFAGHLPGELCTPTGAAILAVCVDRFEQRPLLVIERIGHGAGSKELEIPNCVRAMIGTLVEGPAAPGEAPWIEESVVELECHIDDMTGQELAFVQERLLHAGALDVILTPTQMKKNRPAIALRVLGRLTDERALLELLFRHSTTLGARVRHERRIALPREDVVAETPWGPVHAKRTSHLGVVRVRPEHDDCAGLARAHGARLDEVIAAARAGPTRPAG